jgi:hypothetical protein
METIKSEFGNKKILFIMDAPRWQIYEGQLDKARSLELNNLVSQVCDSLDLQFIDLTSYMQNDYSKNKQRFETDYDGHWNEYGHKFVAQLLYEHLKN